MHQTSMGKQWHFGVNVHIGVDSESGLIYSVETTAVNVHDLTTAHELLHGEETVVYADAGYQAGLIQSVAQPPWSGLRAWCEVGGIASSLCPKPFLPQPTST
jgi:IS5 family transposase